MNTSRIKEILSPEKTVQIEVKGSDGRKLVQKATVQRVDDLHLILNFQDQGNIFEYLNPNTDLAVICKDPKEPTDYVFFTKLIRVVGSNPPAAILRIPTEYNKGRQSARFDVTVPFSYFIDNQEFKGGVVHNLSLNGLLATIQPNPGLKEQERVAIKLFIPNIPFPLLLSGNITRINKEEHKYQMAMHFPYVALDIQDKLVKFLFSAQKKMAPKAPESRMDFRKNPTSNYRKIG